MMRRRRSNSKDGGGMARSVLFPLLSFPFAHRHRHQSSNCCNCRLPRTGSNPDGYPSDTLRAYQEEIRTEPTVRVLVEFLPDGYLVNGYERSLQSRG